jgi:signal transduction histidine kinase
VEPKISGNLNGKKSRCVAASQQNGCLVLTVEDNGVGLASATSAQHNARQGGVGLSSVRERLDSLYGGHGEFVVRERPDQGVVAEVRLPLRPIEAGDHARSNAGF